MNRFLFSLFLFISFSSSYSQDLIDKTRLKEHIEYLASDELMGRDTGSEGIEKAAQFIETHFSKIGLKPFYETYRDSFMVKKMHAYNIIGLVEGTDEELKNEYLMVGAHYDHIGVSKKKIAGDSIVNGANDNASGTVAVMQLANHFANHPPKRSLLFVLFSAEEKGLLGSRHLAKRINEEKVQLTSVFNIEMIGVPLGDQHQYKAYFTGFDKSNYAKVFNESESKPILGLYDEAEKMGLFRASDNWPFYDLMKIPAHTVCTFDFTNYDYYHHPKDEAVFMDITHMHKLIQSFAKGLEKVANTEEEVRIMNNE